MDKAALIMDMPESCDMCNFVDGEKTLYCGVQGVGEEVTDYISCRPDWCPLRELPEKKETNYYMNNKGKGIVEGWNACLDAILHK